MRIHNWYSDLLLSSTFFLNNNVLKELPINSFQFNIGNSSFQLDYNPNFNLPAAIVNFENSRPSNNRPNIFQFSNRSNVSIIPILHNENRDITLELQEEHFIVNFAVNINCESQLQALEIKHLIEAAIPLGKYLHLYEFTSFLNIDDQLLVPCLFDINKHKINNLFLRHNKFTDKVDYNFSVQYNPLVKINDLSLNIGDTNETSFQIALSFEVLTPMPYYLIFPKLSAKKFQINKFDVKVPVNSKTYVSLLILNTTDPRIKIDLILQLDDTLTSKNFIFTDNISGTITYKPDQEITDIFVSGIIDNSVFKSTVQLIRDLEFNTISGNIFDSKNDLIGTFTDIVIDTTNSKITSWVKTKISNKDISGRFTFDFELINKRITVKDVIFSSSNKDFVLHSFLNVLPNNVYSVIRDINKIKTTINPLKSKLIGYVLEDQTSNLFHDSIDIQPDGSFQDINISGILNLDSGTIGNLTHSINNLDQLIFDLIFDYQPCGDSTIERITLDFRVKNETISSISPITLKDYSSTLKNFLIDNIVAYKNENNRYSFKIVVDNAEINSKNFYWKFLFFDGFVTDSQRTDILLDIQKSSHSLLSFNTTESFFRDHLEMINNINPLLFEFF